MLPKLTVIQNAMNNMPPLEFEELVRVVYGEMYKHHPRFSITHSGKEFGKDTPAKHPIDIDVSFIDDNNSLHHILIAVSNQQKNLYSENGKLKKDCDSILEYIKKHEIKNVEIIAVYSKNPTEKSYSNVVLLQKELNNEGIHLSLINAETLNIYINEYCPHVYKQYFDLNVYSGGISYLDQFVDKKLGDYYKYELLGRDEELKELQNKLFQERAILIRGHSGCGKTRLAIELAKTVFGSNSKCLWIESFNLSSKDEFYDFYDKNIKTIVIIDDVNKVAFINELLNTILQKENTYVIMTVRDYLFDEYKRKIDIKYHEYQLKELEPNKIKNILKTIFKVNDKFLDYILLVTRNNLRFSIMAAKVLAIDNKPPKSIGDIFEAYYKELVDKTGIDNNEEFKRTVAALAFFDSIDLRSEENNKIICSSFGIKKDDFLEMCDLAHEKEIADFYFDRMFIKISDQIFAEYLFYKYVFVYKKIDIFNLFKTYYKNRKQKFIQILKALVNIYYSDNYFQEQLEEFKNKVLETKNRDLIISFFNIFSKMFVDESINYSYNELKACDIEIDGDFEALILADQYLNLCDILLSNYDSAQYSMVVDDLLFLLQKNNLKDGLIKKIISNCSIKKDNYENILSFYTSLIDELYQLAKNNDEHLNTLFEIVKIVHPYESNYSEFNGDSTVTFCRMVLPFNDSNKRLRKAMWNAISFLHQRCFDDNKLNELVKNNYAMSDVEQYRKYDLESSLEIAKNLDYSQARDVVFAYSLLRQFLKYQIVKEFIAKIQVNDESWLYFYYVVTKYSNKYGIEYKNLLIENCFKKYHSISELTKMLSRFYHDYGKYNSWSTNNIIANGFEYISSVEKSDYDKHLLYFLSINPDYSGNPCFLTAFINDKSVFLKWIENSSLKYRHSFIASILFNYQLSEINNELYDYALAFFTNEFIKTMPVWGNENIASLETFEQYRRGFIFEVLKRISIDAASAHFVEALFFIKEPIEYVFDLINNDFALLKKIYFGLLISSRFYDHDGKVTMFLLSKDPSLLKDIIQLIIDGKTDIDRFNILYCLPNFVETFIEIIISSHFAHINFAISHCVEKMPDNIFISLVENFVQKYKDNLNYMQEFSIIVEHRDLESQIVFVDSLITNKVQKRVFDRLYLFGGPTSWSGSRIPYLNNYIDAINNYLINKTIPDEYKCGLEEIIKRLKKSIRYEEIEEFNRGY